MATACGVEYEPTLDSDNTEVKVPISKNDNSNLTNDMMYSPLSGVNGDDKYFAKYNHLVQH